MCDIEKMFYQFHVKLEDRDNLRSLWWEDDDISQEPVEFKIKVNLFRATSSLGCVNYGLKHLAKQLETEFPLASKFVSRNFYVDGVTSVKDTGEAISLVKEARELCCKASLRLPKFVSNDRIVVESITPSRESLTSRIST